MRIKDKKPSAMKLSSMSEHWQGMPPTKSGKNRSQEMQRIKRRNKNRKVVRLKQQVPMI